MGMISHFFRAGVEKVLHRSHLTWSVQFMKVSTFTCDHVDIIEQM